MMERKIRIPTQKRALEKLDKILEAAYRLFNEKGYYNTTTAEIAKEANVSTGSVYAYFEDKKDIYIQIMRKLHERFCSPSLEFWAEHKIVPDKPEHVKEIFRVFLKMMLEFHNFSKLFHDESEALKLLDEDIAKVQEELDEDRLNITKEIFQQLSIPFKSREDANIFFHYSNVLVDDLCHTILYRESVANIDRKSVV